MRASVASGGLTEISHAGDAPQPDSRWSGSCQGARPSGWLPDEPWLSGGLLDAFLPGVGRSCHRREHLAFATVYLCVALIDAGHYQAATNAALDAVAEGHRTGLDTGFGCYFD